MGGRILIIPILQELEELSLRDAFQKGHQWLLTLHFRAGNLEILPSR